MFLKTRTNKLPDFSSSFSLTTIRFTLWKEAVDISRSFP